MNLKNVIFFLCFLSFQLSAQDSLLNILAAPVILESTRLEVEDLRSGKSVIPISIDWNETGNANSLQSRINELPGVFSMNQNNSAQDLRIAVRGFGARSAFGIRGIKVIVDGIPYTTPDGQSQVDQLVIPSLKKIEMVSGAASGIYGNSSGGVLYMNQFSSENRDRLGVQFNIGSFNSWGTQIEFEKHKDHFSNQSIVAYSASNGYREHSISKNLNLLNKSTWKMNDRNEVIYQIGVLWSPEGQDPGGLNLEDVESNRRSARDRNLLYDAGEEIFQLIHGLKWEKLISENKKTNASLYHQYREINIRLPFSDGGMIDLKRNFIGGNVNFNYQNVFENSVLKLVSGIDFGIQRDFRIRFNNNEGSMGDLALDQLEYFYHISPFIISQWQWEKWSINGNIRYDINTLGTEDGFMVDGDQSGSISLNTFSPGVNTSYLINNQQSFFANISNAFETPTLNELSNNPSNIGGFNEELGTQNFTNLEIGYKTRLSKIEFLISAFYIQGKDEILPFEIAEFPGRLFYRNSGKTRRQGLELYSKFMDVYGFNMKASYSFSSFTFADYQLQGEDLSGNALPGIPMNNYYFMIQKSINTFSFSAECKGYSHIYLDNQNTTEVEPFNWVDVIISKESSIRNTGLHLFLELNNIFNTSFYDNLRINAFGGRYYEPAPGFHWNLGLKFEL